MFWTNGLETDIYNTIFDGSTQIHRITAWIDHLHCTERMTVRLEKPNMVEIQHQQPVYILKAGDLASLELCGIR